MQTDLFEVAKQERDSCIAHVYDWKDFTPSLNNGASSSINSQRLQRALLI